MNIDETLDKWLVNIKKERQRKLIIGDIYHAPIRSWALAKGWQARHSWGRHSAISWFKYSSTIRNNTSGTSAVFPDNNAISSYLHPLFKLNILVGVNPFVQPYIP